MVAARRRTGQKEQHQQGQTRFPPYAIFHDSILLEILNRRPASLTELGEISGVGQAKLAKYGDAFLGVLEGEANRVG